MLLRENQRVATVKLWTGPTCVKGYADMARVCGFENVSEGTEHVYFDAPACRSNVATIYYAEDRAKGYKQHGLARALRQRPVAVVIKVV